MSFPARSPYKGDSGRDVTLCLPSYPELYRGLTVYVLMKTILGFHLAQKKKIFCLFQDSFLSKIFWSQRSKAIDSYLMHSFHFYRLCYVLYDATGSSSLAGRRRILLLVDEVQPLAENESAGRCVLWTMLSRQSACMENMISWVY